MRFRSVLRFAAVLLMAVACVHAQSLGAQRESAVKAAYLFKFAGFVEWPASAYSAAEAPFVISVMGDDAVVTDLEQLTTGRNVDGRPVLVRKWRESEPVERSHLLFIGHGGEARLKEAISQVAGPVLIVTEAYGALSLGSALNFVSSPGRVRFEASVRSAESRGLKLSSRLLAVAQAVDGRSP